MTAILVLFDTHLKDGNIHSELKNLAASADLVLHAGNFASQEAYDALKIACKGELWAVCGDFDTDDQTGICIIDSNGDPLKKEIEESCNDIKIYMTSNPCGSDEVFSETELMSRFVDNKVDLLVFGQNQLDGQKSNSIDDQPLIVWREAVCNNIAKKMMLICPGSSASFFGSSHSAVLLESEGNEFSSAKVVSLPVSYQGGWRWCRKCQGLFFGPNQEKSICPSGGLHDGSKGSHYYLAHNDPNACGQAGWRWCNKCQGLFYAPSIKESKCPADGKCHVLSGSANYILTHNDSKAPGQSGWRLCQKCKGLFYDGSVKGLCPVDKKEHRAAAGNEYRL